MAQKLKNSVVVITGASSGIGRATAIEFAKKRARLVLAARSEDNLDETAEECRSFHTEVFVVPADVSREDEVQNVAEQAMEKFGRIDVWVNDAGVGFYGRFEEIPSDAFRQVIETNLFGSIYGARAALPQFRKQGRGVLINISSQLAFGGAAYSSAYAISKYGLRALSDTLRQEFEDDRNIHICTVYPASTDTPFFQHSGNYTGRAVKPLGSVSKPEEVAQAIVRCAEKPKADVLVGKSGYVTEPLHWFAPELHSRVLSKKTEKDHFQERPSPNTKGNLFSSSEFAAKSGGWKEGSSHVGNVALGMLVGGGMWWLMRQQRRPSVSGITM